MGSFAQVIAELGRESNYGDDNKGNADKGMQRSG